MEVEATEDPEAAARRAAELIASAGRHAIAERGSFRFAVSGGSTPWRMLQILSDSDLDWSSSQVFQVDERVAPSGSEERNLTHIILSLPLECQSSIRPMPVGRDDLAAAAEEYASYLPDRLDLVHLGLGPDGHTASLVPGDPVLEVSDRPVALTGGEYQGTRRMTLTYPVLERAREVVFLVTGASKVDALGKLRDGDRSIPAARVANERISVVADAAALGRSG